MEERRRWTSVRQLELLIEFMEANRDLALGRVRSKEARTVAARLWRGCAEILNAVGPARTGKEWSKVWNDHKCRVRAKLVTINASQRATGGGPSNAPTLTPLEARVANILGRDIGPLAGVRQDQFASDGEGMVLEAVFDQPLHLEEVQDASTAVLSDIIEADLQHVPATSSPVHVHVLPTSPVPSLTGQAPSHQTTPTHAAERPRQRRVREWRRIERAPLHPTTPIAMHSGRNALEESRRMVLHIEEMRAEAALNNSRTASTLADAFKVIAESIERISERLLLRQPNEP